MTSLAAIANELRIIEADLNDRSLVKMVRELNGLIIDLQHSFQHDELVSPQTARKFDKVVQDLGEALQEVEQDTLIDFGIW